MSAVCLDRNLSDHRPIFLREVVVDYRPSLFRVFHSWFCYEGFDQMIVETWNGITLDDSNMMVRFKKKLQILKNEIQIWVKAYKQQQYGCSLDIRSKLHEIDIELDKGGSNDDGDEKSKFFHGIINSKVTNLAVKGVMVDGEWLDEPCHVKEEFRLHFANRFSAPSPNRCKLNFVFPNKLSLDLATDLERLITRAEVRSAVWGCGENKSPGPDGFTFEFFANIGIFLELIFVLRLIGSSSTVRSLEDVIPPSLPLFRKPKTPSSQIIDGPFIINELLFWCKYKKQQAMVFKVDFAKAYDSVRWDFLDDVLDAFGFGSKWRLWICSSLYSDDAVFIGEWNEYNLLGITQILRCFSLLSGLNINLSKSHLLGVGVYFKSVSNAASIIGCSTMRTPFKYLGVMVGDNTSKAFDLELHPQRNFSAQRPSDLFPRIYALETFKRCSMASKLLNPITLSLRREVRGEVESDQLALLEEIIGTTILSTMEDRWTWDLNSDRVFRVKDVRYLLDDHFLPKVTNATRWVKFVPIKINVFAWKLYLDRLPTRSSLLLRDVGELLIGIIGYNIHI
uniref:RNA-directed DNA polymerase, eukaryota n=1 Tax=Tanacetum cinerariifolium TaxID=118510 RepID=A0A6L2LEK9_TANCI|nr:RNA-directed DNA polymerase, eukaryota [Tanacetum cinerariifolium]